MKEKGLSFLIGVIAGTILCLGYYYLMGAKPRGDFPNRRGNTEFSRFKENSGSSINMVNSGTFQRKRNENNQ